MPRGFLLPSRAMSTREYTVNLGAPNDKLDGLPERLAVTALGDGRFQVEFAPGDVVVYDARRVARGAGYGTFSLQPEGGGQWLVDVEGDGPDFKVHLPGGELVPVKLGDAQSQALAARPGGAGGKEVRAPMPGKTVKVLCAAGQAVKAGQGLVIIEAMKMENELRAQSDGVVKEVRVMEGQNVEGSALLVVLE